MVLLVSFLLLLLFTSLKALPYSDTKHVCVEHRHTVVCFMTEKFDIVFFMWLVLCIFLFYLSEPQYKNSLCECWWFYDNLCENTTRNKMRRKNEIKSLWQFHIQTLLFWCRMYITISSFSIDCLYIDEFYLKAALNEKQTKKRRREEKKYMTTYHVTRQNICL